MVHIYIRELLSFLFRYIIIFPKKKQDDYASQMSCTSSNIPSEYNIQALQSQAGSSEKNTGARQSHPGKLDKGTI